MIPQIGHRRGLGRIRRHEIADEASVRSGPIGHHDGFSNRRSRAEACLDLAQFDPVTSNLDLMVDSSEELERPVTAPAGQIARPVDPLTGTTRIVDERLRGQFRALVVAAGDTGSTDEQFARYPDWGQLPRWLDDVTHRVGDGLADRNGLCPWFDPVDRRPHRRLGRTEHVPELIAAVQELGRELARHRLSTAEHLPVIVAGPSGVEQHAPGDRRCLHDRRSQAIDERCQSGPIDSRPRRCQHRCRTDGERQQQLEDRDVERERGHSQQRVVLVEAGTHGHCLEEVGHTGMVDDDALWSARRARGVDDVGQLALGIGEGCCVGGQNRGVVRVDDDGVDLAQDGGKGGATVDHDLGRGVFQHELESIGGIGRVEGHIGGTGLEHGQERRHHLGRPVAGHPDDRAAGNTPLLEVAGHPVCPPVQLGVGDPLVTGDQGYPVRCARHLLGEELVDSTGALVVDGRAAPLGGLDHTLGQRQASDRLGRARDRLGEEVEPMIDELGRGHLVEQVDVVANHALVSALEIQDVDTDLVVDRRVVDPHELGVQAGDVGLGETDVGHQEHGLQDRRPAQVTWRPHVGNDLVEWGFLVGRTVEDDPPDLVDQGGEVGVEIHPDPQREGVHDEADQGLGLGPEPVGRRGPDDDVVLAGVAGQGGRVAGQEGHEEGGTRWGTPGPGRSLELRRDLELVVPGPVGPNRRSSPVDRERQDGQLAAQLVPPVGDRGVELTALQATVEPVGVVGEVDRRLVEAVVPPLDPGLVELEELADDTSDRPTVTCGVVQVRYDQ